MNGRAEGFPDPTGGPHLNHLNGFGNAETPGLSEKQIMQIRKLTQIGRALSAERSIERLLEMIVQEAREFTGADGGTLYIMSDDETELQFAIVQTETLPVRMGGTGGKITTPEYVVDKATKLETIFDRIELLRLRFELFGLQARLRRLNKDADLESAATDNDDGIEPILREESVFCRRPTAEANGCRMR